MNSSVPRLPGLRTVGARANDDGAGTHEEDRAGSRESRAGAQKNRAGKVGGLLLGTWADLLSYGIYVDLDVIRAVVSGSRWSDDLVVAQKR